MNNFSYSKGGIMNHCKISAWNSSEWQLGRKNSRCVKNRSLCHPDLAQKAFSWKAIVILFSIRISQTRIFLDKVVTWGRFYFSASSGQIWTTKHTVVVRLRIRTSTNFDIIVNKVPKGKKLRNNRTGLFGNDVHVETGKWSSDLAGLGTKTTQQAFLLCTF